VWPIAQCGHGLFLITRSILCSIHPSANQRHNTNKPSQLVTSNVHLLHFHYLGQSSLRCPTRSSRPCLAIVLQQKQGTQHDTSRCNYPVREICKSALSDDPHHAAHCSPHSLTLALSLHQSAPVCASLHQPAHTRELHGFFVFPHHHAHVYTCIGKTGKAHIGN
jgi:hypothetical protein